MCSRLRVCPASVAPCPLRPYPPLPFLSTPHRVVDRTPEGVPKPDRLALIYFCAAGYDVSLSPHTRLLNEALERPRFAPVLAGMLTHNYLTAPVER